MRIPTDLLLSRNKTTPAKAFCPADSTGRKLSQTVVKTSAKPTQT